MKESEPPFRLISRDEFIDYLDLKIADAAEALDQLEQSRQSILDAEDAGKIVRFFENGDTIRFEIKNKPPLGFK